MKKPILAVWFEDPEEPGKSPKVNWEYGKKVKCWTLIGILESIKLELLGTVDEATKEADDLEG